MYAVVLLIALIGGRSIVFGTMETGELTSVIVYAIQILIDVYKRQIEGSSDASIHEVIPNDLSEILATADIRAIYTNGGKAFELYDKMCIRDSKTETDRCPDGYGG